MKILLTVHEFFPDFFSGTETLTYNTAKALQELGHEVFIFTGFPARPGLQDSERFDRYSYDGIPVERFHHSFEPMGGQKNIVAAEYNNLLFAEYFRDYVRKLKPDIVHFFHLQRISAVAIDVCHEIGIPLVLTPTDFWSVCFANQLRLPDNTMCTGPDKSGVNCLRHMVSLTQQPGTVAKLDKLPDWLVALMLWFLRKGLFPGNESANYARALASRPDFIIKRMNMIDRLIVPTRLMMDILIHNGVRPDKMLFCPFGIKLEHLSRQIRTNRGALRIGFIGTLAEHKGPHVLVKAVRALPENEPIALQIYGNPNDYPEYSEDLRQLAAGDQRISFCGTFPSDRIGDIFSSLDVLVVPSIWYENSPLVIYCSQAAGCPVIASNMRGLSEVVVHGENGLLFEPGDENGLAEAIRLLVRDRELLQRLSENTRRPKSIAEYADQIVTIYNELLVENGE